MTAPAQTPPVGFAFCHGCGRTLVNVSPTDTAPTCFECWEGVEPDEPEDETL